MLTIALTASPFSAFQLSDWVGRSIVLILIVVSILSWTIILEKHLYLRRLGKQIARSIAAYQRLDSPLCVFAYIKQLHGPPANVINEGLSRLAQLTGLSTAAIVDQIREHQALPMLNLSPQDADLVALSMNNAVDEEIAKMEERLAILGSIVSATPFLGLLGTVWGVMMAFTAMAAAGKADINALAPGVSGALLTTVVALLVAIPALIGYNLLISNIRQLTLQLENFTSECCGQLRAHQEQRTDDG